MTVRRRDFLSISGASLAVSLAGKSIAAGETPDPLLQLDAKVNGSDPWIELDFDALISNVTEIRKRVSPLPIMAVVKCNAYGHGDVEIAAVLQRRGGIENFMVVKAREAIRLRESGIDGVILNAGPFASDQIDALLTHGISQAVYTDAVADLSHAAGRLGTVANVQIYVDTGMGRVGVPHPLALELIEKTAKLPHVRIEGIFTDMTEDDDFNPVQIERLEAICNAAKARGIDVGIRHAASSNEVNKHPYAWLDMVRPGSCIVGLEGEKQGNLSIRPVMSFKTRVAYVKTLQKGDSLSYHRAYKINKTTRIATLPCGYSDGYPPVVSNKADVLIRGKRHRLVGPITANHMMVDVTGSPDIEIGDEAVLWGQQGSERITMSEIEQLAPDATNAYRMATRTRTYLQRVAART